MEGGFCCAELNRNVAPLSCRPPFTRLWRERLLVCQADEKVLSLGEEHVNIRVAFGVGRERSLLRKLLLAHVHLRCAELKGVGLIR